MSPHEHPLYLPTSIRRAIIPDFDEIAYPHLTTPPSDPHLFVFSVYSRYLIARAVPTSLCLLGLPAAQGTSCPHISRYLFKRIALTPHLIDYVVKDRSHLRPHISFPTTLYKGRYV